MFEYYSDFSKGRVRMWNYWDTFGPITVTDSLTYSTNSTAAATTEDGISPKLLRGVLRTTCPTVGFPGRWLKLFRPVKKPARLSFFALKGKMRRAVSVAALRNRGQASKGCDGGGGGEGFLHQHDSATLEYTAKHCAGCTHVQRPTWQQVRSSIPQTETEPAGQDGFRDYISVTLLKCATAALCQANPLNVSTYTHTHTHTHTHTRTHARTHARTRRGFRGNPQQF